jgi:hypothetical protein
MLNSRTKTISREDAKLGRENDACHNPAKWSVGESLVKANNNMQLVATSLGSSHRIVRIGESPCERANNNQLENNAGLIDL